MKVYRSGEYGVPLSSDADSKSKVYIVVTNRTIWGVFKTRSSADLAVSYAKRAASGIEYTVLDYEVEDTRTTEEV